MGLHPSGRRSADNDKSSSTNASKPPFDKEPRYESPSSGILSLLPDRWRPYGELVRLDKPGFALLWMVHTLGILQAAILNDLPGQDVGALIVWFLLPCQALMLFNFSWNDTCDVEFDRLVWRTRHRPLVRGALTLPQALGVDGIIAGALLGCLLWLPVPCTSYAVPLGLGCVIYPLTKRWSNYPQVFFALILGGGVYVGAAGAGSFGLPYPEGLEDLLSPWEWTQPARRPAVAMALNWATVVFWSLETEIVYSYQDAAWDEAAGVGTMTRLIPDHIWAKRLLFVLATLQLIMFGLAGAVMEAQATLWAMSVCLTGVSLAVSISSVDLKTPESCLHWFGVGNLATGSAMILGYSLEYLAR